jgi:hypothetical protein
MFDASEGISDKKSDPPPKSPEQPKWQQELKNNITSIDHLKLYLNLTT